MRKATLTLKVLLAKRFNSLDGRYLGIILFILALGIHVAADSLTKAIIDRYHFIQIIFLRSSFRLLPLLLILIFRSQYNLVYTRLPSQHFKRFIISNSSMISFILAYSTISLTEAYSVSYTSPLFLIFLSNLILKEKINGYCWIGALICMIGTFILLNLQINSLNWGYIFALASAFLSALDKVTIKQLSKTESPFSITFFSSFFMVLILAPIIPFFWQYPSLYDWFLFSIIGSLNAIFQYLFIKALTKTKGSTLAPFDYVSLVWVSTIDAFVWHYKFSINTLIGIIFIICGNLYIIYMERNLYRKRETS